MLQIVSKMYTLCNIFIVFIESRFPLSTTILKTNFILIFMFNFGQAYVKLVSNYNFLHILKRLLLKYIFHNNIKIVSNYYDKYKKN